MSDASLQRTPAPEAIAIDVAGTNVGVVVYTVGECGYRFRAATRSVDALDGHVFANPRAAEQAARLHVFAYQRSAA